MTGSPVLQWLLHTDAGLAARIGGGVCIFALLAVFDFRKHGKAATRWREYGVLLAGVALALAYGAVNDQVTVTISPEYFLYGKELANVVGDPPGSPGALRWAAAKVGLKATWTAGLVFAVVLLLANNPWRDLPRLKNRQLVRLLPLIVLTAALFGVLGGALGYAGVMTRWQSDFRDMAAANLWRPNRYMAVWGVHLGGYVGGVIGTVFMAALIASRRLGLKAAPPRG